MFRCLNRSSSNHNIINSLVTLNDCLMSRLLTINLSNEVLKSDELKRIVAKNLIEIFNFLIQSGKKRK